MRVINLRDAKTHLSRILEDVANNHDIVTIAKSGKPMARLVPIVAEHRERRFGFLEGQLWIADDFDGPLSDDLRKAFEGDA
jgi:prevent-host-death family protein